MGSPDDALNPGDLPASGAPAGERSVPPTQTYVELMERLSPGSRVAGRHRILSIAGVGGMGVVYRARDEELGVDVALKVLRRDLAADPRALERFRSELLSARQVTHRNVVRLHDIGEHEGMRFLTMDYVAGRSLREVLEREGRLPLERAAAILRQVAEGLEAAHAKGIIHRDLKPGNILLDESGTAYVTDFGVARSLDRSGVTRAGAIVGTPDYLAPEQVAGEPVDARADVYALGIVFFEMLSGELPFPGQSQTESLAQRLAGRPRDIRDTGVEVPAWARRILRRCLERSPGRRYQTARALIEDLDRGVSEGAGTAKVRARTLAAAALAVLLAAGTWFFARRSAPATSSSAAGTGREPAVPAARHAVAVLPLADQTGLPSLAWTGPGLAEMLSENLSESPNLRVLDSLRVARGVRDLRLAGGPIEDATARQLSELWSVDTLVTGTVRRAGTRVRVDLAVLPVGASAAGSPQSLAAEGAGEADIFRIVGDLGTELRRRLGLPRAASGTRASETASLEAARAYEEGRSELARGDDLKAAPAFERAVAPDPRFAAALERLAETYQDLGYHDKAVGAADRALAAAGKGEGRAAYRARARLALLRGDPAGAEKSYLALLHRFPNDMEPRLDLASAQAAQGHNAEAVATLKAVVAVDSNDPRAWFLLGKNTILMGDSTRAIKDYLVRALALQDQLHNEKGKADVLAAIARAYQRLNDFPKALENYTAAWKIQSALNDELGQAGTLRGRALILQAMGKPREAETDLAAARRLYEKIGDRVGMADAWNASGVVAESRGAYRPALEAYQEALKLRRTLGNERLMAQSYDNVGYIYYLQGQYEDALVYWQQGLDLRRKIGEKSGVVFSLQNLGFLQTAQGQWDQAVRTFVDALEKSREIGQKDATVISLGNLGVLYELRGRFSAALSSFDEALGIAGGMNFAAARTEFTLKKAGLLLGLGRGEEAGALLAQAETWVAATGNREQQADLEVLRGQWNLARGDAAAARAAFDRAQPPARESGSRVSLLRARLARASAQAETAGGIGEVAAVLREAESLGQTAVTLEASEDLGRAELSRRRLPDAERVLQKAIGIAEPAGWNEGLFRLYALRARALEASGRRPEAAEEFARSAREIARLRENVPAEMRASFDSLPEVKDVLARTNPAGGK